MRELFVSQFSKGCSMAVVLDDVSKCDDVLEAVPFGDMPAFIALASYDKHRLVLFSHLAPRANLKL